MEGHGGDFSQNMVHWIREWEPFQYFCLENPLISIKRPTDRTLKDELSRSVDTQYATGNQWRNNSRKNEETELKQKQHPVVDMTGDGSKSNVVKNNIAQETEMLGP